MRMLGVVIGGLRERVLILALAKGLIELL
jgi:hypothetical protein